MWYHDGAPFRTGRLVDGHPVLPGLGQDGAATPRRRGDDEGTTRGRDATMESTSSTGDFVRGDEVPEADAQEQQQDALTAGATDDEADPEAPVGPRLSGRDLDAALASANEADLAEQEREVPFDDDFER